MDETERGSVQATSFHTITTPKYTNRWSVCCYTVKEFLAHEHVVCAYNTIGFICLTVCMAVVVGLLLFGIVTITGDCTDSNGNDLGEHSGDPWECRALYYTLMTITIVIMVVTSVIIGVMYLSVIVGVVVGVVAFLYMNVRDSCIWVWTSPDSCFIQPCMRAQEAHEPLVVVMKTPVPG